jgi:hypothetical protein
MTNAPRADMPWLAAVRVRKWTPIIAALSLLALVRVEGLADPNVSWGIRDGRQILSSGSLPRHDTWSWTVAGRQWTPNSWLWDVLLGGLDRIGGAGAVAVLNVVFILGIGVALAHIAFGLGADRFAVVAVVGALGAVMFVPWFIARAQLASYAFVLVYVHGLRRVLLGTQRRYLFGLGALLGLQVLWINLHFFGVLGPVLVGASGIGLAVAEQSRLIEWRAAFATVVALGGCLISPYGVPGFHHALTVHNDVAGLAVEWRPSGFGTFSQVTGVLALLTAVAAVRTTSRRRAWDRTALIVLLAIGTAAACRIAPVLALVTLPEVAAWLPERVHARRPLRWLTAAATALVAALGLGIALTGLGQFGSLAPPNRSPRLVHALPNGCRVLNDYAIGGAILLHRQDVLVSVDSRTDLYRGTGIRLNRDRIDAKPGTLEELDSAHVTCVLVPNDSGIVAALAQSNSWHQAGRDNYRTLFVR